MAWRGKWGTRRVQGQSLSGACHVIAKAPTMLLIADAWGRCAAAHGVDHGHRRAAFNIVGASLPAIFCRKQCPLTAPNRLQASSYKDKTALPSRSRPAGDFWREVMPVDPHESLAGKLLQRQDGSPL